jgi:hypothetical protein
LTAIKNALKLSAGAPLLDETEKYKKTLEHCCGRIDLLQRMIKRYKTGLLDSIFMVKNGFSSQ